MSAVVKIKAFYQRRGKGGWEQDAAINIKVIVRGDYDDRFTVARQALDIAYDQALRQLEEMDRRTTDE